MPELSKNFNSYPDHVELYDDEDDLNAVLEQISSGIGWIIIEFNSLEGQLGFYIKEQISSSNRTDEFAYMMLANVGFNPKYEILMNIYSRIVDYGGYADLRERMVTLDQTLREAGKRRNQYAHADWTEISTSHLVGIKLKAGRNGLYQVYRTFTPEEMKVDRKFIAQATEQLVTFDEDLNARTFANSG